MTSLTAMPFSLCAECVAEIKVGTATRPDFGAIDISRFQPVMVHFRARRYPVHPAGFCASSLAGSRHFCILSAYHPSSAHTKTPTLLNAGVRITVLFVFLSFYFDFASSRAFLASSFLAALK
jgi:hypothetical protein